MTSVFTNVLVAFQFLTRLPLAWVKYRSDALIRSAAYFPIVGAVVGACAWLVHILLRNHLPSPIVAITVLLSTILITGALHEDGLADVADGFGGGWNREQVLTILKDSRIGSYGALALIFSIGTRFFLLSQIPDYRFGAIVICAHTLCRWTALPLGYGLAPARLDDSQGARIAGRLPLQSVSLGTIFMLVITVYFYRLQFWRPLLAAILVTTISAFYFKYRINGVTGDCFGATNQLTEIAVYLCGVWH
jgi:adenosylcobinamide-GDP ribazoletransferase